MTDLDILTAISAGSIKHIEILVERHESRVLQMATDLTGSTESAEKVCEQVFVEICQACLVGTDEELDKMIHRLTYELAIASLLGSVEQHTQEVKEVFSAIAGEEPTTALYEVGESDLQKAKWQMAEANVLLSDLADAALTEMH